ncbi:hypothetical protein QMA04_02460 [Planococcus sp. APC 3900]|uniref:hypothetical protein n=1 Tax=Planococcus sp. APC 3900 TaxID=3035191 RepID=UPI0025B48623|nr:hypothetical protein [Planococcus sp. APC 3900]MBF6634804.1 hypothetical protein [Planococcus sp. (in: firmicutes)]MDN3436933.1 hypothetical protein [Planococcus sp. APC 3900]
MYKVLIPVSLVFLLTACGGTAPDVTEETQTEVTAPKGELDPTAPAEAENAEFVSFDELSSGNVEEGAGVSIQGTVEELADDIAFPSFIVGDGESQVYVRNMAETPVEVGDRITADGIFEGKAEEEMPMISASLIEKAE